MRMTIGSVKGMVKGSAKGFAIGRGLPLALAMVWLSSMSVYAEEPAVDETRSPDPAVRGRAIMREVSGIDIEADDPWLELSHEHLFAEIWSRPGLTRKERRWISLTLSAASGQKAGYMSHLRGALESGDITEAEMWEWLLHYTHYAGWPAASNVWVDLRQLIDERAAQRKAAGEPVPRAAQPSP